MAIIEQFEKKYTAPGRDFFTSFPGSIADGTYTPYSQGNSGKDSSFMFIEKLKNNVRRIMEIFNACGELTEQTGKTEDNSGIFTTITMTTEFTGPGVCCIITLDRMENGHLGCNEDDITMKFQCDARSFTLDWYVYTTNDVIFKAEKCSEKEISHLDDLFRNELGLIPSQENGMA